MSRARLLIHLAGTHKLRYFSWFLLTLSVELLPLFSGLALQLLFDALEARSETRTWLLFLTLFGTVPLARLLMIRIELWAEIFVTYARSAAVRRALVARILEKPGAAPLSMSPGEAISRLQDDVDEVIGFLTFLPQALGTAVFAVASTWIMIRVSAAITLAIVVPLLLVVTAIKRASTRVDRYRREHRAAEGSVAGFITAALGNVQAIQVCGAQADIVGRLERMNKTRAEAAVREKLLMGLLDSVFLNTVHIAVGAIILMSVKRMRSGSFTIGDLALFEYYLWFIRLLPAAIGQLLAKYAQVGVSIDRINELDERGPWIEQRAERPANPPAVGALQRLEVAGLSHDGDTNGGPAMQPISFALPVGSFTVVTGPIGSGKSTLLRVLLGLLPKCAGRILWNGVEIPDPASFFVPPRAAYVGQSPRLISASVEENILLGMQVEPERLARAIESAVLSPDLEALQGGSAARVGPRGARLSGGQAQRVAAARALVREPELLIFDDVSSALDAETENLFWQRVGEKKATVLAVSHRPALLARADQVIVLDAPKKKGAR